MSQWDDKSGNGYHVTQIAGSEQPDTGARTLNSLNVIDFNTVGHNLVNATDAAAVMDNTKKIWVFVAAEYDDAGTTFHIPWYASDDLNGDGFGAASDHHFGPRTGGLSTLFAKDGGAGSLDNRVVFNAGSTPLDAAYILAGVFDRSPFNSFSVALWVDLSLIHI